MNKDMARVLGIGIAAGAFVFHFMNIVDYGANPGGIVTFLYLATALAMIGNIFMIFAYTREPMIIQYKMIIMIVFIIINVVFAIPAIDWTNK